LGGVEEKLFLMDFLANYSYSKFFGIYAGAGFQNAKNKDNIPGNSKNDGWAKVGITIF